MVGMQGLKDGMTIGNSEERIEQKWCSEGRIGRGLRVGKEACTEGRVQRRKYEIRVRCKGK